MSIFEKMDKRDGKQESKPEAKPEIKLEAKPEPKIESKPETVTEVTPPQTFVIKTELDAYVNERLISQPHTIEEVHAKDVVNDSLASHMLKLPTPIQAALDEKGMVPRWINKDKRMIDRALDIRGWTLFNKVFFPRIPKHYFTANGTVEMGDCILGFMPASKAEILRKRPGQISQERIKNLPIEAYKQSRGEERIGYYKPAYTAEPDGEVARREAGLFAQPDVANLNE